MLTVLAPLVLLASGLAGGVLVGAQLGGYPLLASLPPAQYVHAHAFFATRYDPFMPICLLGTVAGDLALAVTVGESGPRAGFAVGALLAACTVAVSVTKNVPINRWVRGLQERAEQLAASPAELFERRQRWGRWNSVRCCLAVLALAANCFALALVL
ncbi:hypothetical protein GCM10010399_83410 [Dactylosporangium fulvum]|uniref:DUF1772 domain-containing protein n=1 Tax=Dactylosporangium fulvum TaxID=53359 RepID=A0ABY5WA62_9ACTN|nr:DUF1772 domain-containing protein [Dactylosporangium fulvum]UWP86104.1 DUF1772 domain-containing protein [Dactylosporangium fulvum]